MIMYDQICKFICEHKGFTIEVIKSDAKNRKRELVYTRQLCFYFGKKFTKLSLATLGMKFGKDHATVLHGIKTINNLMDTDKIVLTDVVEIERGWVKDSVPQTVPILILVNIMASIRYGNIELLSPAEKEIPAQISFDLENTARLLLKEKPDLLKNLLESLKNLAESPCCHA